MGHFVAEEHYEKDFRIPNAGGLHAGQRNRFRLHAQTFGQSDNELQEKEQEETQTALDRAGCHPNEEIGQLSLISGSASSRRQSAPGEADYVYTIGRPCSSATSSVEMR